MDPFTFKMQDSDGGQQASVLPGDMAKLIKQTIEKQMVSWQGMVSSIVKDAIGQALDPIQKGLSENGDLLKSLKAQIRAQTKKFDSLSSRVDGLEIDVRKNEKDNDTCRAEMIRIQMKLSEIEDRARINNVRLVNLPIGAEGDDPRGFLQRMLPKWIPTLKSLRNAVVTVDKAHRIFSNNKKSGPNTMIFRLLHFPDRQAILEGARNAKPALSDGTRLLFFADYSPGTTKARRSFKDIRAKLWQQGIETKLVYPAVLKVTYKGKKMSFDSAEAARAALDPREEEDATVETNDGADGDGEVGDAE